MILLTVDEIVMLHDKLLKATGGLPGLRDRGLLESAVLGVDAGFEDIELYPTVEEKAARLAYALVANHAFVDGNKRVGGLAMLMTLTLNKISLRYTQTEFLRKCIGLPTSAIDFLGLKCLNRTLNLFLAHIQGKNSPLQILKI